MSKRQNNKTTSDPFQTKGALHEHIRQMLMLERLCARFHLVATRLRSRPSNRAAFQIEDEYDVQDLLQALLMLDHDDVRPETWTPSYSAGSSRTDFLLRLEHIVVEARLTRSDFGVKELGEQLSVDIQKYQQHPECQTLVCFIYDPDGRIDNPRAHENDLSREQDGLTVRVIIAPKGL